jgi:pimeloyl-ACP methyl ester carboxylesterase
MAFSPLQILSLWLRALVAAVLITASVFAWREWYNRSAVRADDNRREDRRTDPDAAYRFEPRFGLNVPTAFLAVAALATAWSLGGGLLLVRLRRPAGDPDQRRHLNHGRLDDAKHVRRADGSNIYTESEGPTDAPILLLTHGWGGTAAEWNALHPHLPGHHRVVRWDLPGLGRSEAPRDRDFSLDRMAHDLRLVLDGACQTGRPVVLVGHSIGAMINLTFARLFPDVVRNRVAGMVLAHGTYTDPLKTHKNAKLYTKLQKPVIEPLVYAAIPLSPALQAFNWLSYLNGSAHRSAERSGFSGRETREQLDFAARFTLHADVAAVARGTLGMLHWDASDVPAHLPCPVLIWAGEKDPTTCPEASQEMHTRIPRSELHSQPTAKHLSPIEFSADFAPRVIAFADAVLKDRTPEHRTLITPPPPDRTTPVERPVTARAPGAEPDIDRPESAKSGPDRPSETADTRARTYDANEP